MRKRKDSVYTSAFIFPSLVHLLERKPSRGQPRFWEAQGGSLGSKPNYFHVGRVFDEAALTGGSRNLRSDQIPGPSPKEKNKEMMTPLHPKYRIHFCFSMKSTREIFLSNPY